jgi:hypothetical protein
MSTAVRTSNPALLKLWVGYVWVPGSLGTGESKKEASTAQMVRIWESVRFEVFTAVTMKTAVFRDVAPCDSSKNRRSGGT